jgi:hypothetical protein
MCEPVSLTIASLALVGAGTAMQMQGEAKAKKAMNEANQLELTRQKGYRDESFGHFDKSLEYNQGETQQHREKKNTDDLNSQFQAAADSVFSGASANGNNPMSNVSEAPKAIGDIYKKSMDEARGSIQNMLTAKAALGGFSKMLGATSIQNQNITNAQTPLGNFMRGSAGVLPLELQAASHKGDSAKNMGAILSALGSIAGMGATGMAAGVGSGGSMAAGAAKGAGTATSIGGVGATIPVGAGTVAGGGGSGIFGWLGGGSAMIGAQRAAMLRGQ